MVVTKYSSRKIAGVLTYKSSEEFKLELIGIFDENYDGTILAAFKSTQIEQVIHGQASDGSNITLFECSCGISHKGCAEFSKQSIKLDQYLLASIWIVLMRRDSSKLQLEYQNCHIGYTLQL